MADKIIITADIHLGFPGKLDDCLWALNRISDYANKYNITTIIILGDLFHDRVNINIEVNHRTIDFFEQVSKLEQHWIIFPGNHDMFLRNSWKINPLRSITNYTTIIESISTVLVDNHRFVIVPFIHHESVFMKTIEELNKKHQEGDVLLTHIGVHGATLNECFLQKNWSIVDFTHSPFDMVFAGHFHCHQKVGSNLWYPGSPIPFNFAEGHANHGFIVYDMDHRSVKFIDLFELNKNNVDKPPDYKSLLASDIEGKPVRGDHVRVILESDMSDARIRDLRQELISNGAKSVKIIRPAEDVDIEEESTDVQLSKPIELFENWLDTQKTDLDRKLLLTLNSQIIEATSNAEDS